MNRDTKTLPQAIKIIVDSYGKNVLNDARMVNIMNDVVSLEDSNAVKTILRDCIRFGYGGKILAIESANNLNLKIKQYSKEISDSKGYKEVIVQYILYSLAHGIGLCPEPYIKDHERELSPKPKSHVMKETSLEDMDEKDNGFNGSHSYYKVIIAMTIIALLGVGFYIFKYIDSSDDRAQFDQRIFSGNKFIAEEDYVNAVESYKEAYNGYNALNSDSYKEAALYRIDGLVDNLLNEGENSNKSLLQAYKVLQSEMQLNLDNEDFSRLQTKKENIERQINERVLNGHNNLITIISANNGKLDENGKQLLEDLLELSPNDYWLNFIKKKSYE